MALILALLIWGITVATVVSMAGNYWPMPETASAHGPAYDAQFHFTVVPMTIAFVLAQVALGYCVWRYRDRKEEKVIYTHGSTKIEVITTIATAIVFVTLGITGQRVWVAFHLADPPANAIPIEITGQQFAWNVRYPGPDGKFGRTDVKLIDDALGNSLGLDDKDPASKDDIVTLNQVAVPVNRPIRLILRSKDVTHDFFVPVMRMKQDTVPGMSILMHFTATKTGKYEVACAELCGQLHYQMRAFLNVMTDQEYQNWLQERAPH